MNDLKRVQRLILFLRVDFKRGAKFQVGELRNVNAYQLMCHVMQLVPQPHNGTWSDACDGLADVDACGEGPYTTTSNPNAAGSWRQDAAGFTAAIIVAIVAILLTR